MDYAKAAAMLRTARRMEDGKPIDRNTRLFQRADHVAVRLHNTDIILFYPDGRVTLNTGGWKTVTTKDRINNFAPFNVWSKRGTWFTKVKGTDIPFADGMTISASGNVTGAGDANTEEQEKELRKRAKAYAEGFVHALYAGQVKLPGLGDCMICRMPSLAKMEHIESHMSESYYVPTLLVTALNSFGASQFAMATAQNLMATAVPIGGLAEALAYTAQRAKPRDFAATQIQKCIRRYVLRQLGVAT